MTPSEALRDATRQYELAWHRHRTAKLLLAEVEQERLDTAAAVRLTLHPCPECGSAAGVWCWRRPPLLPPLGISRDACAARRALSPTVDP